MVKIEAIKDYFQDPQMFEELKLVDSGLIRLHWSNYGKVITELQLKAQEKDILTSQQDIQKSFEQFQRTPVWVFNRKESRVTNLYDLYCFYLDPRMRELWFELNHETLVSLKGEAGPFIRLQSLRWFDPEIFKVFIFHKLLNGVLPERNFRLTVDIPLEVKFNNSVIESIHAQLVQLSETGLLIRFDNKSHLYRIERHDDILLKANLTPFLTAKSKRYRENNKVFTKEAFSLEKDFVAFRLKKSLLNIGSNQSSVNFSSGDEFFVYFNFTDVLDGDRDMVEKPLVSFVRHMEKVIHSELSDKKASKIVA